MTEFVTKSHFLVKKLKKAKKGYEVSTDGSAQ